MGQRMAYLPLVTEEYYLSNISTDYCSQYLHRRPRFAIRAQIIADEAITTVTAGIIKCPLADNGATSSTKVTVDNWFTIIMDKDNIVLLIKRTILFPGFPDIQSMKTWPLPTPHTLLGVVAPFIIYWTYTHSLLRSLGKLTKTATTAMNNRVRTIDVPGHSNESHISGTVG